MRLITRKHCKILTFNSNCYDGSVQFTCGFSTTGFSLVYNFVLLRGIFDIVFPFDIHILKGFAKNLWCKTRKLKNDNKMEFQLYFKDDLNTGISLTQNVEDFQYGFRRSYVSISVFGFTMYIAKIYPCIDIA